MATSTKTKKKLPHIRNSERKDFLRCQQRWWWAWEEGLRVRGDTRLAFWFGTGIHEALAFWYGLEGFERGPDPRETWLAYCQRERHDLVQEESEDDEHFQELVELGTAMLRDYLALYGDDPDIEVICPERSFWLYIPGPDGKPIVQANGTFDLVFRSKSTGKLWLGEHKTAKAISTTHLPLDNQGGFYFAVATHVCREMGFIGKKEKLQGILYNFLRKAKMDPNDVYDAEGFRLNKPIKKHYIEKLVNGKYVDEAPKKLETYKLADLESMATAYGLQVQGDRSASQPATFYHREKLTRTERERKQIIRRVGQEAQWMGEIREGRLPILKNPTTDCHWDCDFYLMCQAHEKGDDWETFRDAIFSVRDPYKDHRKAA